jgi:hypothetical protein
MKLRNILFGLACVVLLSTVRGQELNCSVQILSPTIQGTTEKRIFENLQQAIFEFMNNTRWTTDQYKPEERIECGLVITITDKISMDEFKATLQITSTRPVYKTSYKSRVFNHNDVDFQFRYLEFQPLEFSRSLHTSNLTSVLAFYAFMILGVDYDSFSPTGGTPYFQNAQQVVNNAQNAIERGWKGFESQRNRYWLVQNMMDGVYLPIRNAMYKYHMEGLDKMYQDAVSGRSAIADAIVSLKVVHGDKPLSFPLQLFFQAKSDEIVNIFSASFPEEKNRVLNVLNEIDPGNSQKYQKILKGGN